MTDEIISTTVSSIRQLIESQFNWIDEKTTYKQLQRSTQGILVHVWEISYRYIAADHYFQRLIRIGNSAMPSTNLLTTSTSLQKAVAWISETMQQHPDKQRSKVIAEAELRFDLTPLECEFLHRHFRQTDH